KLNTPPGDDKLALRGDLTLPFPFDPPLDPLHRGLRLLINDAAGGALVDANLPGAAFSSTTHAGWMVNLTQTMFLYRHNGKVVPPDDGINKVVLTRVAGPSPGHLRFSITGKNGSYGVSPAKLPLKVTLVIDAPLAMSGQCGEALFPGLPHQPTCRFNAKGATL